MNISLAHYQLPLFGLSTTSLATEIGADQRSIFLRPITAAGELPSESWPATVEVQETNLVPKEYRRWLAQITNYQEATGGTAESGETEAAGSESETDAAGSAETGGEATTAPDASSEGSAEAGNNGGTSNGGTNNSQNGTSSSANSGTGNGNGSGGLLGLLLG